MRSPLSTRGERQWALRSRAAVTTGKQYSVERQKVKSCDSSLRSDSRRGNEAVQRDFLPHAETVESADRGSERRLKAPADGDVLSTALDNLEASFPNAESSRVKEQERRGCDGRSTACKMQRSGGCTLKTPLWTGDQAWTGTN